MKVLVVWEEVPEDSYFIILEKVSLDDLELLKTFHDKYINHSDIDEEINKFFYNDDAEMKYEQVREVLEDKCFALIIKTGIMM